ncbi:MAG: phosphatidylglycerophosphatase A [Nitrospinota bacterium]
MVRAGADPWAALGRGIAWGFAAGGGAGLIPKVPGTAGTLLALGIYLWVPYPGDAVYLAAVLALFLLGIPLGRWAERRLGRRDDPRIVWDEMVGMWVALYALPPNWYFLLAAFALFRAFDIWKPFGEPGHSGLGVMLDDLLAGVSANICLQLAGWLAGAFL